MTVQTKEQKKPTAATVLFGPEESYVKVRVASILHDARRQGKSIVEIVEDIFHDQEVQNSITDYEVCPLIIQALIAELHSESRAVIRVIGKYFESNKLTIFPLGIVLGLFRGIQMYGAYDEEYRREYGMGVMEALPTFIFGNYMFENQFEDEDKQKGKLSEAMSEYFKPENPQDDVTRLSQARDLISSVNIRLKLKIHTPRQNTGIFGDVLINELCFKVFRSWTTRQRIQAVGFEWDDQVQT